VRVGKLSQEMGILQRGVAIRGRETLPDEVEIPRFVLSQISRSAESLAVSARLDPFEFLESGHRRRQVNDVDLLFPDVDLSAADVVEKTGSPEPIEPNLPLAHDLAQVGMGDRVEFVELGMEDPGLAVGVGLPFVPDAHLGAMPIHDAGLLALGPEEKVLEVSRLAMGMEAFECRPTDARVFLVDDRSRSSRLALGRYARSTRDMK
jgi:hypothetical protein